MEALPARIEKKRESEILPLVSLLVLALEFGNGFVLGASSHNRLNCLVAHDPTGH